jgi:sporulation protein YlmC with PRC-barrel domain
LQFFRTMPDPLRASADLDELPVYDVEGLPVGRTFGVLAEAETGLVRYFDVALDERRRHVLIPVGHTRVEKHLGRLRVRLRAAAADDLEQIPAYEPHVAWKEDQFQNELLTAFGRLFQGERYYAHPAYDHAGLYAGKHPILREPLAPAAPSGLHRMSRLPRYHIAEGEPDIIAADVFGEGGAHVGVVTDVIIDPDAEQVRYVIVKRDADDVEVAVPVGYATVQNEQLTLPFKGADLEQLPQAPLDELTRTEEATLRVALDGMLSGARRYARPDFRSAA